MKNKKMLSLFLIAVLAVAFTACKDTKPKSETSVNHSENVVEQKETTLDLAELQEKYIHNLVLTTVIGQSWNSPEDLNADDVLTTYQTKLVKEKEDKQYLDEDGYLNIPQEKAESYAKEYFGMTPELLRKSEYYDSTAKQYRMLIGLGGAWGVEVTEASQKEDLLELQYNVLNALDEVTGQGVLTIQLRKDGTYQYLSNVVENLQTDTNDTTNTPS